MAHIRLSRCGAAFEQGFYPLAGDGVPAVHSAQQRAADGGICVGVSPALDGVHHGILQIRSMQELPQGVAECRQNPPLLVDIIRWR
mgnify:CR=1 FL=1